ncbi:MAG: glycosyltransferase, partial [Verrucomicrobiota bacterium]
MSSAKKFVVVIPCLNEAAEIFSLVTEIRKLSLDVIVVDDGSTDGTGQLATRAGAEVFRHQKPQGKGAAL